MQRKKINEVADKMFVSLNVAEALLRTPKYAWKVHKIEEGFLKIEDPGFEHVLAVWASEYGKIPAGLGVC
jgi:hypothetical protein